MMTDITSRAIKLTKLLYHPFHCISMNFIFLLCQLLVINNYTELAYYYFAEMLSVDLSQILPAAFWVFWSCLAKMF